MADYPEIPLAAHQVAAGCLSTFGNGTINDFINITHTNGAVGAWPVTNKAVYMPVYVHKTVTVYQIGWENGTAVSGNVDVGIYQYPGWARLVSSGSTAQVNTSTLQIANIADTILTPGVYFLAMSMDNTTGTVMKMIQNMPNIMPYAVLEETSAFVLPSTATPVLPASTIQPLIYAMLAAT